MIGAGKTVDNRIVPCSEALEPQSAFEPAQADVFEQFDARQTTHYVSMTLLPTARPPKPDKLVSDDAQNFAALHTELATPWMREAQALLWDAAPQTLEQAMHNLKTRMLNSRDAAAYVADAGAMDQAWHYRCDEKMTKNVLRLTAHLAVAGGLGSCRTVDVLASIKPHTTLNFLQPGGITLLHAAAQNHALYVGRTGEFVELLDFLMAAGIKPRSKTAGGHTPLHYLAPYGDLRPMAALLARGAGPDTANRCNETVSHALLRHHPAPSEALSLLCMHRARLTVVTDRKETLLHCLMSNRDDSVATAALLERGLSPHALDHMGLTPLDYALMLNRPQSAALLQQAAGLANSERRR